MKITVYEARKNESIEGKFLLDPVKFKAEIVDLFKQEKESIRKDVAGDDDEQYYEMAIEAMDDNDHDENTYERLQNNMYDFVRKGDFSIPGNFNHLDWDWERDHEGGIRFSDLRKKLLDGVKDVDTDEFSTWGIDWFFDTFGTFGLLYNYRDAISDLAYSYEKEDKEAIDLVGDESKKSESIASDIRKNKPKVLLSDDAVTYFDDYDDMLDEFETAYQTYVHVSGNPDEDVLFLYVPDENIVAIGDFDVDHEVRDRAKELMEKFVRGELVKADKPLGGLDYVVIEDGNTYTATAFVERE